MDAYLDALPELNRTAGFTPLLALTPGLNSLAAARDLLDGNLSFSCDPAAYKAMAVELGNLVVQAPRLRAARASLWRADE